MKIKTLVIAPYQGLVELTTSLKNELQDFDINIIKSDLSEALPIIEQIEKGDYDLIISRGGTAQLLRHHSSLPVVEIHVSGYDILRMLVLVKDYKVKMEVIGFQNIIDGFVSVSNIMNIDIPVTVVTHESEVNGALEKAKDCGVKLVLGDTVTTGKAAEYGIQGVLITSGKESVLEAFEQAKHIFHIMKPYNTIKETYENLINYLDIGVCVLNGSGVLQFANQAFRKILKPSIDLKERALFDSFPFLRYVIETMEFGTVFDNRVSLMDPSKTFVLEGGKIDYKHNKDNYYLKISENQMTENEVVVIYQDDSTNLYPPLLVLGKDLNDNVVNPESDHFEYPLALYGEKGSGKRFFAGVIRRRYFNKMIELNITRASDYSMESIGNILQNSTEDTLAYICGVNNASLSFQKALYKMLPNIRAKVIFSFDDTLEVLLSSGVLEQSLYELISKNKIFIPSLRTGFHDLESMVRSLIIYYNERLGKQTVGIRQEVLSALLHHDWSRNLIELQETIKQFIIYTSGEYITEEVLPLLNEVSLDTNRTIVSKSFNTSINLNQSLDEIERDVIMAVLEEEQMNQSRAAKRLGINRTTLWRKVKQGEEKMDRRDANQDEMTSENRF